MSDTETKPFYQSTTLIGAFVLIIPNALRLIDSLFGTKLDNPEITTICTTVGGYMVANARLKRGDLTIK